MKAQLHYISFLLLLTIFYEDTMGQRSDAGLWTSMSAEKKISSSFSVSFSETFRFNENVTELGNYFTEIALSKKIVKGFTLSLGYRFINKRELNNEYSARHRYLFDLSFRKKLEDFSIGYRSRFQTQVENYFLPAENYSSKGPEIYWRNKIALRYQGFKKIKPSLGAEFWYPLNSSKVNFLDNVRSSAGIEYDLSKRASIELEYIIQKELQKKNPQTDYITSLSYTFAF